MSPMDRRRFLRAATAAGLAAFPGPLGAAVPWVTSSRSGPDGDSLRASGLWRRGDYPLRPVPLEDVRITDGFWRPRMEVNREVSLGYCFERFEEDSGFSVSKLIEAAAYMVADRPDPVLEAYVDGRIERLLDTSDRRIQTPEQSVRVSGHFLEAAAAYSRYTGKRRILDAAVGIADQMDQAYGPGKRSYISGHEGLKIGLISLFRATGDDRYWKLAKFFADERGREDYERSGEYALDRTYAQDHLPVVEQAEAVGHCVRATFLYIPMTDISALADSDPYREAVQRIWQEAVFHKTYLTGGIGSIRFHEQFGAPYELPNLSAWNETCAAYGNVVWNHRMFLLERDARYIDVMERVLYNALLVGVSREGDRFFYQNPLKSFGDYERFEWINVPCCPPNVVRMIASVGNYIYATDASRDLYVNLFVDSDARVVLGATPVRIRQETRYPWEGSVRIQVDPETEASFSLFVRIPGWAGGSVMPGDLYRFVNGGSGDPTVRVNGRVTPLALEGGYARLQRSWRAGDEVELELPMPVRQVEARPEVRDDRGRV
ncbi:MAG: glycoside hydrolase family 127 protein, partial [Longimicrobiales bacterium]|nr:glycoside hydrolase family 127 protein [Longimicrobiales bacterium]